MQTQSPSLAVIAFRMFWMMIGPIALGGLGFAIIRAGTGWLTALDVAFFLVLGAMVLARWLEFKRGDARTATGEPASEGHLRRYVVTALGLGLTVWVLANLAGNHWLH
jgi:hypothetical protein